jgi:hypothetical protein
MKMNTQTKSQLGSALRSEPGEIGKQLIQAHTSAEILLNWLCLLEKDLAPVLQEKRANPEVVAEEEASSPFGKSVQRLNKKLAEAANIIGSMQARVAL